MVIPARAYCGYAVLLAIWLSSFKWGGRTRSKKNFDHIVFWAVVFALTGILIGYGPRPAARMPYFAERMNLLKFYPFRLADVLVPVAVAASLVSVLERTLFNQSTSDDATIVAVSIPVMHHDPRLSQWIVASPFDCRYFNRYSPTRIPCKDWLDVCRWIDENLPAGRGLVETPTNGWAFKWFAKRAEYVAFKDCPQDAAGIVEWNRSADVSEKLVRSKVCGPILLFSERTQRALRRANGNLTHLLTDRLGPLELDPIYPKWHVSGAYDLRMLGD